MQTTTIFKLNNGCTILEAFQATTYKLYAIEQTMNIYVRSYFYCVLNCYVRRDQNEIYQTILKLVYGRKSCCASISHKIIQPDLRFVCFFEHCKTTRVNISCKRQPYSSLTMGVQFLKLFKRLHTRSMRLSRPRIYTFDPTFIVSWTVMWGEIRMKFIKPYLSLYMVGKVVAQVSPKNESSLTW